MVGSFAWTTTITTDNGLHRIYFLGFNYIVFLCSTFIVAILFLCIVTLLVCKDNNFGELYTCCPDNSFIINMHIYVSKCKPVIYGFDSFLNEMATLRPDVSGLPIVVKQRYRENC